MTLRKYPPTKDRRDIGQVVFPIEKMAAAREISSCCVGVEAALETNSGLDALLKRFQKAASTAKTRRKSTPKPPLGPKTSLGAAVRRRSARGFAERDRRAGS